MITISVKEAMPAGKKQSRVDIGGHFLYMIRDEDIVLYVGQGYVYERLRVHMSCTQSVKPSRIGQAIIANMPYSLGWQITVYTLADCAEFVRAHNPSLVEQVYRDRWDREAVELAEFAMIKYFKPCLNIKGVLTARN
jgi:hypothetical protein